MLALRGVTKSFRTHAGPNVVLRDVTLEVPRGCLYGLIGPGAAGKSVVLKLLAGLLRPDSGQVLIDDKDITELPESSSRRCAPRSACSFRTTRSSTT